MPLHHPPERSHQDRPRRSLGRGFSELGGRPLRDYLDAPHPGGGADSSAEASGRERRKYGAIAVASGKGGTGKSTVAANLAALLGRADLRVLLVDADFGLANLHLLLGLQPKISLARVLLGGQGPGDVALDGPPGVRFVPGCSGVERMANLHDGQMRLLARSLAELEDGSDVVLLDTAAGLARQTMSLLRASSRVLLITTPDIGAMTDAYALLKLLTKQNPKAPCGLVVNRARSFAEAQEVAGRLRSMVGRFLGRSLEDFGWVPEDDSLARWANEGKPIALADPQAAAARALQAIANRIIGTEGSTSSRPTDRETGFFDRLCEPVSSERTQRE